MKRLRSLFGTILVLAFSSGLALAESSEWTSHAGAQITARFVRMDGDLVVLQPEEGPPVSIRLNQLVPEDQQRAQALRLQAAADDDGDDDDSGGRRLPVLPSGPGQGFHAFYRHDHFHAQLDSRGELHIQPIIDGKPVGNSFLIRPGVGLRAQGRYSQLGFGEITESGAPQMNPRSITFEVRTRYTEEEVRYRVEYTFDRNQISVICELVTPRRTERNMHARADVRFAQSVETPPEMPQAERRALLKDYSLRWRIDRGSWNEEDFYNSKRLRPNADELEISGPWGSRTVHVRADNRRDGNRSHFYHYSGRPLNDGFRLIRETDPGARGGPVHVTVQ